MFTEEIKALQQGKAVKCSSAFYRLSPVLRDKILRVGGRLSRSSMLEESTHPAILAKDHPVSHLILRSIHVDRYGVYGVIFTCLTLRAVHVEIASSLDTDSCIHAVRRFVSRRGQVNNQV